MYNIAIINLFSMLMFACAAFLLVVHRRKTRMTLGEIVPLVIVIGLFTLNSFSNVLEHSNITDYFDSAEDIAELLGLPFCLFFLNNWHMQRSIDALREKETWLQVTFDSIPDGVMSTDPQGRILMLNKAMENLVSWSREEAYGKKAETVLKFRDKRSEEIVPYNPFKFALKTGTSTASYDELCLESRQNAAISISEKTSVINGIDGRLLGAVGLFRDMTEYDAMQEQLLHVRKMEALGQLAGGVAHDLNNMLGGIVGAAELLGTKTYAEKDQSSADQLVQLILKASSRASELTMGLLDFSRKGKIISTPIVIQDVVKNTVAIAERTIDKKISIKCDFPEVPLNVIGDPAQLQNCFLNLLVNARDAMPQGGAIVLSVGREQLTEAWCNESGFDITPGEYVYISVADTGTGIPESLRQKIFEPYVTTKAKGKGTGLGLAAVHGTVCSHQGAITLESDVGKGSIFSIHLPLTEMEVVEKFPVKKVQKTPQAGTVLVVEDEAVIRVTTEMMLESHGYHVLSASSGEAGIALFVKFSDDISLVLLDMVLPGISGFEIFKQLQKIDPNVNVVVTSGFAESKELFTGISGFIKKPYRQDELLHIVNEAIMYRSISQPANRVDI